MIVSAKRMRRITVSACREKFLSLLPQIREQAQFAFRHEGEQRDELIAEVIANACVNVWRRSCRRSRTC